MASIVKLRKKLNAVEMKYDDLSVLFEQVACTKNSSVLNGHTVEEENLIATIMEKAHSCYSIILATKMRIQAS